SAAETTAFENASNLLTYRKEEIELRKKYYREMGAILNGVIAMQFLQTEAMMDMLESASIYSRTDWEKYRFHAHSLPNDQVAKAKSNTLEAALNIPYDRKDAFWSLYRKYEVESNALMGEAYDIY